MPLLTLTITGNVRAAQQRQERGEGADDSDDVDIENGVGVGGGESPGAAGGTMDTGVDEPRRLRPSVMFTDETHSSQPPPRSLRFQSLASEPPRLKRLKRPKEETSAA